MDRHEYYQVNWSYWDGPNRVHKGRKFTTLKKFSDFYSKHLIHIDKLVYDVYHVVETKLENTVKDL